MGKQRLGFLSDFVEAITRRKRGGEAETLKALARPASERARVACAVLMGRIGDAARVAVAEQALSAYAELDAEVERWCAEILEKSPTALALAKRSFNADTAHIAGISALGLQAVSLFYGTEESQEGVRAFQEKRKPRFRER